MTSTMMFSGGMRRLLRGAARHALAVLVCLGAGPAFAATYTWNVTSGLWTDNLSWAPTTSAAGTGPTSADTIVYAGAANQTIDLGSATRTASILTTNALSATSLTLTATNGSLVLSGNANQNYYATSASSGNLTYDFSGLSGFSYNASTRTFSIGWDVGTATGTTTFNFATQGSGTNTITAQTFQTAGPGNGNFLGLSVINLGKVNTINSSTFAIGGYSNSGTVAFGSGVTNGSLVLRGTAGGTARVDNIYVGQSAAGAGSNRSGSGWLNLTGGSLDARATTTTIGGATVNNQSITSTGVLTLASGTLDTLTLVVGSKSNVGSPALTATVNQNGGFVLSGTLRFGDIPTSGSAAPTFTSIYNLASGTLGAALITTQPSLAITATTTANASSVRRIAWSGGTIANYDASTDLTISGTSTNAGYTMQLVLGSTTTPQVFSADSGRTITIGANAVISGTGLLQKEGAGTLRINTAATYTGSTGINGGTVQLGVANGLPTTTGLSMSPSSGNATLDLNGFSQTLASLASSGAGAAVIDVAATGTSTLTVGGDNTSTTFAGTLRNSGGATSVLGLTKNGTGTLTLTGSNSALAGNLVFNAGKVTIDPGSAGSFTSTGRFQVLPGAGVTTTVEILSGSNSFSTAAGIGGLADNSNTGTAVWNIAGGTTTLSLTTNRFLIGNKGTGNVNVSNGELTFNGTTDIVVGGDSSFAANNATGAITVSGGTLSITGAGNLALGRNSGSTTGANGTVNLDGGVFATVRPFTTGASGTINFNGGTLRALGSTSDFIAVTTANIRDGGAVIDTNSFNVTIGQALLNTGTGGLTKINSGTLTLSASNSYIGSTTIAGGVLSLGTNSALAGGGSIVFSGGTLQFTSGNTENYASRIKSSTSAAIALDTNGQSVTFSGTIDATNTGGLSKSGAGTLRLNAASLYSGSTSILAGTVRLGVANALPTTTGLSMNPSAGTATLDLNGFSQTLASLASSGVGVAIIDVAATGTSMLTVGGDNTSTAFAGTLRNSGGATSVLGLTKNGTGTLTLTGSNSALAGNLVFNAGKVTIDPGATGSFTSTGRFQMLPGSGVTTTVEILSGSNSFSTSAGTGGLADNATTGTAVWNIAGGATTLALATNRFLIGNKGTGTVTVSNNAAFTITGTPDLVVGGDQQFAQNNATGSITVSSGTLSITGAGNLILGRNATISGTTTGANGTINLDGGVFATARPFTMATGSGMGTGTVNFNGGTLRALASSGTFIAVTTANVKNGGAVFDTNTFNVTVAQPLLNSGTGGLRKLNSGTLTLGGANTYVGSTLIDAGTLKLGASGSLASSLIKVSAGAIYDLSSLTGYALGSSQTLAGSGTVLGDVVVAGGATLSPGNSPGTLYQTGNETWGAGGNYNWQLYDSGSTAIAGTGWDLLDVTGALAITATGTSRFNVNLWTLSAINPDVNGAAINFDGSFDYAWDFATFSGGITGFDPTAFHVVTSATNGTGGFLNIDATGMFSVRQKPGDANTLQIFYASVPEPTGIALAGVGVGLAAWLVRRRRPRQVE